MSNSTADATSSSSTWNRGLSSTSGSSETLTTGERYVTSELKEKDLIESKYKCDPNKYQKFLADNEIFSLYHFTSTKNKDSIMSRMNYYNQFKYFKNDKKLEIKFGRQDDKNKKNKSKKNKEEI